MRFLFLNYKELVVMLAIVVIFFAVLLILGIRKSYKLKKENENLYKESETLTEEDEKKYEDFTGGHMYQ